MWAFLLLWSCEWQWLVCHVQAASFSGQGGQWSAQWLLQPPSPPSLPRAPGLHCCASWSRRTVLCTRDSFKSGE